MTDTLTIALSKGKLLEPAIDLFKRVGLAPKDISSESRRLIFEHPASGTTLMIVRPSDVPTYVEYGAVDAGVVGADILMEQAADVFEPLDLGFGFCRLAVAAPKSVMQQRNGRLSSHPPDRPLASTEQGVPRAPRRALSPGKLRVATKYPNMTERYFTQKGIPIEIIKLYGSVELAPLVGLADRIVDLVSTGKTLHAHNLVVTDVIAESTARLIVNRASLKLKFRRMNGLIEALRAGLQGGRS
jgi:ATP phosphoribosyltransferase